MKFRLAKTFTLLLLLCSVVFSQAILVHNGNGNILHSGLVLDYQFTEGSNQLVFNRVGGNTSLPNPVNQYGSWSEQFNQSGTGAWTKGAGVTVTDFFATDPNGNNNASRLVMTGAGSQALYFTITTTNVPWTVSFYVKSNTGSSQACSLGRTGSPSADKTVTTSWTRVDSTFTPTAGSQTIGILNDAAHDALDILIYGAQLEIGSSATAYIQPTYNQQLGTLPVSDAADPTWSSTGLAYTNDIYTRGIGTSPLAFSSISLYAVFKKTGADAPSFFEPIFTSDGGAFDILMESRDSLNGITSANETGPCFGFGFTGNVLHAKDIALDTSWHAFTATYDGTTMKLYWDGTQVSQRTVTISTKTVHRFFTGMFEGLSTTSYYFPGSIGMIDVYTVAHSGSQVRTNTNAMFGLMGRRGIAMNSPVKFIGYEGDSITAGTGLTPNQRWSWIIDLALSPKVPAWNFAVGGSTVADATARAAITDSALNPATPRNTLTVWFGANDLSGGTSSPSAFVASLKAYCLARKAAGWQKIVIIPILPRGDIAGFNTRRNTANALVAADPDFTNGVAADIIATIDNVMFADGATSNPLYYQVDLVHPTALGCSTYLGPNIQTAIVAVY